MRGLTDAVNHDQGLRRKFIGQEERSKVQTSTEDDSESVEFWERYDNTKTKELGGSIRAIENSFISAQLPRFSTHTDFVKLIATKIEPPMAIGTLSKELDKITLPRGRTIWADAMKVLDDLASNYEAMYFWVSSPNVLNVDLGPGPTGRKSFEEVLEDYVRTAVAESLASREHKPRKHKELGEFDNLAGSLWFKHAVNGKLSRTALLDIARELDRAKFKLLESLQRSQRRLIGESNSKMSRKRSKISSFEQACSDPKFVYCIRRRLYEARDRHLAHLKRSNAAAIQT
jgi:hypothetical protein